MRTDPILRREEVRKKADEFREKRRREIDQILGNRRFGFVGAERRSSKNRPADIPFPRRTQLDTPGQ